MGTKNETAAGQGLAATLPGLPPWMAQMRAAAQKAITEEDIAAIVQAQVQKAKAGNEAALRWVMDFALGGQNLKGASFVQNNFEGAVIDGAAARTIARPGSSKKLSAMSARAKAGLPLTGHEDGPEVNLE